MSIPITRNPLTIESSLDSLEISRRRESLQKKATAYYEKLQIPNNDQSVVVAIDPVKSSGFAALSRTSWKSFGVVAVHPFLVMSPDDFPEELRLNGLNDPLLCNRAHIMKIGRWLGKTFRVHEIGKPEEIQSLLFSYLAIWENPEALEDVRNSILAHEVAHFFHNHKNFLQSWPERLTLAAGVCSAITGAFTSSFSTTLLSTLLVTANVFSVSEKLRCHISRKNEKEADLTGLRLTGTTKGAEVFFSACQKADRAIQKANSWRNFLDPTRLNPSKVLDGDHPAPLDRIAYLKAAQSEA